MRKLQKNKKMKIGVDLDDVVVEFSKGFLDFYNKKNNTDFRYEDWDRYWFNDAFGVDKSLVRSVRDEFFNSVTLYELEFVKGAKGGLRVLSKNNELYIVTSRPLRFKQKTDDFINQNFPNLFSDIFYSDDADRNHSVGKAKICMGEGISVLIEDNLEYALYCLEHGINSILLGRRWNEACPDKVLRVKNWKEILEKIGDIENGN